MDPTGEAPKPAVILIFCLRMNRGQRLAYAVRSVVGAGARLPSIESLMSCHAMPCTALIDRLKAIEFITDELVGVSSAKPAVVDRADTPGYDSTTDSPLPYGSPTYRIGDREPAARFASDSAGSTQPRPRLADPEACTTWMGVCRLGPGRLPRRIDLKAYPRSQYPFAVFYFTGAAVGVMSM